MKNIFLTLFVLFSFFTFSFSQQKGATMSFDKEVHDYGLIKESAGKSIYNFRFVNTGSEPLILNNVKASCGCTTPKWTKQPILPSGEGFIEVAYNPKNRPGKFNKTVTVHSNAGKITLRIKGEVSPKERKIEDIYAQTMGDFLRLKNNHLAFTKLKNTEKKTLQIEIFNTSKEDMKITFERVPKYFEIKTIPEIIKAGEKGVIQGTYDAVKQDKFGFASKRIGVLIDGKKVEIKKNRYATIAISATIEEDFTKLSKEELDKAAKIEFDDKVFNFKKIKQGDKVDHVFKFKNTGKSDLIIRRTKASCGCTAVNLGNKKVYKPGENGEIKVTFNSRGKKNRQNKRITVITNDPANSTTFLKIIGQVEVAPKK